MVAATVMTGGLVGCTLDGVDRDAYVRKNERLFEQLPKYPGSRVVSETSTSYGEDESGPVVGYETLFELTLPTGASVASVGSFYQRRLRPRWRLVEKLDGAVFNFRQDNAFISVNLENVRGIHAFEVAVDHAYFGKAGR
jgi:hypothetical protein